MQTYTLYSAESCRAAPSRSDARRLCSRLGSEPPAAARQAERVPRAPGACSGAKPTGHLATAARQLSLPSGWFPEKHSGHPGSEPGCARGGGGEIKPGMGTRGGEAGGVSQAHRSPEPGPGAGHGLHHRPTPSGKGPPTPPRSAPLGLSACTALTRRPSWGRAGTTHGLTCLLARARLRGRQVDPTREGRVPRGSGGTMPARLSGLDSLNRPRGRASGPSLSAISLGQAQWGPQGPCRPLKDRQ